MLFRHRSTAEGVAAALAHSFADATSSMYNNITDYVLGPMHGQPYPVAPEPRPLPSDSQIPSDGCWPDDSDSEPEDPGTSELLPVTDAESTMDSAASDISAFESIRVNMDPNSLQPLPSHNSIAVPVARQQSLDDTPRARHSFERPASPNSCSDRPSSQRGGASLPPTNRQRSHSHAAASRQRTSVVSTAQRYTLDTLSELKRQFNQDDSARSSFSFALPLLWIMPKRSRSDDSAHEKDSAGMKKTHMTKGSAENGPNIQTKTQQPVQAIVPGSFKQHKFLLQFCNTAVEKQFCLWQAQQLTKVCWHSHSRLMLPLWLVLLVASISCMFLKSASLL